MRIGDGLLPGNEAVEECIRELPLGNEKRKLEKRHCSSAGRCEHWGCDPVRQHGNGEMGLERCHVQWEQWKWIILLLRRQLAQGWN